MPPDPVDERTCGARMKTLETRIGSLAEDVEDLSAIIRREVVPGIQQMREQQIRTAEQFATVIRLSGEERERRTIEAADRRETRKGLMALLGRVLPYIIAGLLGGAGGELMDAVSPESTPPTTQQAPGPTQAPGAGG